MARPKQSDTPTGSPVEKAIVGDIKKKLDDAGAQGYKIRVTKKGPGGYQYRGWLNTLDSVEDELLQKFGEGYFNCYAHLLDGRRVDGVPPFSFVIGDAEAALKKETEGGAMSMSEPGAGPQYGPPGGAFIPGVGVRSRRVAALDEEIEATRRERELRRIQREFRKSEEEEEADGRKGLDKLEAQLERLREERDGAIRKSETDRLLDHVKRLEDNITKRSTAGDPEKEAMKARLEALEREKKSSEMALLKQGFDAQINLLSSKLEQKPVWNLKEIVPLVAPVVAAITTYLQSAKSRQTEVIEAIKLLKDTMGGSGMNLKELLPIMMPLLQQKGPDLSAIFSMVSDIVSPMVEAAAQAATNPPSTDDVGGMIRGLLSQVGKSVEQAQSTQKQQAEAEQTKARALIALSQREQARRPLPAPPAPPVHKPAKQRAATPMAQFAKSIAKAIATRDNNIRYYIELAEAELSERELNALAEFRTPVAFAGFLSGQPGASGETFHSPYGQRWLATFLNETGCGEEPDEEEGLEEETPEVAEPPPQRRARVVQLPKARTEQGAAKKPVTIAPRQQGGKIREPNEFLYPDDSVVEELEVEGILTKVEFPSQETVAKREEERRKQEEEFKKFRERMGQASPEKSAPEAASEKKEE